MTSSLDELVHRLFLRGLGQLLVLHVTRESALLGNLYYEKGKLTMRDRGYLIGVKPEILSSCWDYGLMGCIYDTDEYEWDSLTYSGPEKCKIPVNLSDTRRGALWLAENEYGDHLIDFVGSVYRAYQLLLENHYLPVVILKTIEVRTGETGLGICDLRAAPIDLGIIQEVNEFVRTSIEKQVEIGIENLYVSNEDFDELFAAYLKRK